VSDSVKLIECPRDAWQGLKGQIPTYIKADYLKALISAGFKHIDAASFVSPKAVPQMADSEGAQRAINTQAVRTLGFPYSVSPTFLRNNQHQTLEEAIDELEKVTGKAEEAELETVVYISMAFGNPYGDPWNVGEVVDAVDLLESSGIRMISLADTVGLAGPAQIRELFSAVHSKYDYLEVGVHLHSRPEQSVEKVLAAYDAGCRRFDSALGGLGGCPFAQDALVGNIPTEKVIEALAQRDADLPTIKPLETLLRATAEIGVRYTNSSAAD
jgi:hydroxymethylglutaryl-CoA lyase